MVLSEDTQAPSHPDVQEQTSGPEEYASLLREIQAEMKQIPELMTPTNPSGLGPWTNSYADLSASTPETTRASDQNDLSPWSTGSGFDSFGPYSQLLDLGYPPVSDTDVSHWIGYTEHQGSSTGESAAIGLRHHSHLGIDAQRHTLRSQRDASSAHPSITDPTYSSTPDAVVKEVVDTQARGSPTGSSSSIEFLYSGYSGIGSSLQSRRQTPQTPRNTSSSCSPYLGLASPVRGIEVQSRHTDQRQQNYPAVGSSSQPQRHALRNVSMDAVYGQAQVSGSSPTNFQDNSYLGAGPSSQRSNVSLVKRKKGKQPQHSISVAPSKRMAPPASNGVRAAGPYPKPTSQSLARTGGTRNVASSSTGPRHSTREEVEEETGYAFATTSSPREPSPDLPIHPPQDRRGRMSVPLRPWRPSRAIRMSPGAELRTIEFWTENRATGKITPGTYFADRFGDGPDPDRLLMDPDQLPLPGKSKKGFNLRILWPGYDDDNKKISIHRPLSESTLRDVRDWVYGAIADFIRIQGAGQTPETDTWRVGVEDPSAIHVEDLILVRVRQVSKGSWVPEIDFFRTE